MNLNTKVILFLIKNKLNSFKNYIQLKTFLCGLTLPARRVNYFCTSKKDAQWCSG